MAVTLLAAPLWIPVCLIAALALLLTAGRPVLYRSMRRVHGREARHVVKFRTMVRNADRVLNRDTVPVGNTAFLNIPPEHPVYTRVGRVIERYALTELPQLMHVLRGTMSLIGNRPLPENVITALLAHHPHAEDRFLAPTGLTGPVQLIGRDAISDADRLALEIDYCLLSTLCYSYRIDLYILLSTVLVALHVRPAFSVTEVRALMMRAASPARPHAFGERREAGVRLQVHPTALVEGPCRIELRELSYRGLGIVLDEALPVGTELDMSLPVGRLRGVVCRTQQRDDGRFDGGLQLRLQGGTASDLLGLFNASRPGAARMLVAARQMVDPSPNPSSTSPLSH